MRRAFPRSAPSRSGAVAGVSHDITNRQADDSQSVKVRSRETPGSLVVKSPASGEILASKRNEQLTGPQRERSLSKRRQKCTTSGGSGRFSPVPRRRRPRKTSLSPGGDVQRTLRRSRRGTARRLSSELGRPSSAPSLWATGSVRLPITGHAGKWQVVERESEGVVVVTTVGTT